MLTYLVAEGEPKAERLPLRLLDHQQIDVGAVAIPMLRPAVDPRQRPLELEGQFGFKSVVPDHPPAPKEPKPNLFTAAVQ
ncbi:hypothetical protein AWC31_11320 [Mycolicibacterium wolinskyi]|uniref:Uncharacterized protein n=1 Tax=Mycolicibacterium wolinskyi TaxID=59750 RepID=A0A1X2ERK5_9MYCO|nr:hypothetical protein AWC31_11320 [Mycolicibacterium wolinskyi]